MKQHRITSSRINRSRGGNIASLLMLILLALDFRGKQCV